MPARVSARRARRDDPAAFAGVRMRPPADGPRADGDAASMRGGWRATGAARRRMWARAGADAGCGDHGGAGDGMTPPRWARTSKPAWQDAAVASIDTPGRTACGRSVMPRAGSCRSGGAGAGCVRPRPAPPVNAVEAWCLSAARLPATRAGRSCPVREARTVTEESMASRLRPSTHADRSGWHDGIRRTKSVPICQADSRAGRSRCSARLLNGDRSDGGQGGFAGRLRQHARDQRSGPSHSHGPLSG